MTLEEMIEQSEFGNRLDERGVPSGMWLWERMNEQRGEHWICATLHNLGVGEYDALCRAYRETDKPDTIDANYAKYTQKEFARQ